MMKKLIGILAVLIAITLVFSGCGIIQQLMGGGYGEKVEFGSGEEVYYKGDATEADAQQLGKFLIDTGYFNNSGAKTVQIVKEEGLTKVRFVVKEGVWNDEATVSLFKGYGSQIASSVFSGQKIEVHLCNDKLETQKAFVPSVGDTKTEKFHKPKEKMGTSSGPRYGKKGP